MKLHAKGTSEQSVSSKYGKM